MRTVVTPISTSQIMHVLSPDEVRMDSCTARRAISVRKGTGRSRGVPWAWIRGRGENLSAHVDRGHGRGRGLAVREKHGIEFSQRLSSARRQFYFEYRATFLSNFMTVVRRNKLSSSVDLQHVNKSF